MSDASGPGWRRAGGAGFGLALVSIGVLVASETVLRADHEVFYSQPVLRATCGVVAETERCSAVATFSIANNGRVAQDDVRVHWSLDARRWALSCHDSDLVGSARHRRSPELRSVDGSMVLAVEIRAFDPNTILDCSVNCFHCERHDLRALQDASFEVRGAGVREADPRATMFSRLFLNMGRVIGALSP
jgi:hypothetical protein